MPKASLVALLAATSLTTVVLDARAQSAQAPATGKDNLPPAAAAPAPPAAAATTPNDAPSATSATAESPAASGETKPTEPLPPAAAAEPASAPGPLLPGLAMTSSAQPTSTAQPKSSSATPKAESILAEDWWSHSRPIIEIHGYFRTRAEMFYNFSLGRRNSPLTSMWPHPTDDGYSGFESSNNRQNYGSYVCTSASSDDEDTKKCSSKTQASANLRLRLNPEIHVSDNLRILTQIDILDNLVLGSTPAGYSVTPGANGGYAVVQRNGYTPLSFFDDTTGTPSAGVNNLKDSVRVKRAWAEYSTPVGQLRFGRMPDHFGLGMVHNSGDGYDHDYQSTIDRIMFLTDIRPLDLYLGGSWDFPSEGATSESSQDLEGQPYDLAQSDDVDQYSFLVLRKKAPELERMALSRGELVLNLGAYVTYRKQYLASDGTGGSDSEGVCSTSTAVGCSYANYSLPYVRRGARAWTPDVWLQLLYKQFRFEMEAATVQGTIDSTSTANDGTNPTNYLDAPGGHGWKLRAWGIATQLQQKLLEDRLDLSFGFGWAQGDPDVAKSSGGSSSSESGNMGLTPGNDGMQAQRGDNTYSTFRFHPSYQIDLILHRNLLSRVQGTYYFRPSVGYDFMRRPNGQRLGGNVAAIWTRASEFVQAPGHERDLGIELNGSVYFQSKDGVLNDRPGTLGGFFTMVQYGLLFPLDGLGYPSKVEGGDTSSAHSLRWYLGVFF